MVRQIDFDSARVSVPCETSKLTNKEREEVLNIADEAYRRVHYGQPHVSPPNTLEEYLR